MKKILILMFVTLPLNSALSADEMTKKDCEEFLPYHSYNVAVSGVCGELLPPDVVNQHAYLRGICTQKLGEKKSMVLMQLGIKRFKENLASAGSEAAFCQAEAKLAQ
jgi:hypothetical protein